MRIHDSRVTRRLRTENNQTEGSKRITTKYEEERLIWII